MAILAELLGLADNLPKMEKQLSRETDALAKKLTDQKIVSHLNLTKSIATDAVSRARPFWQDIPRIKERARENKWNPKDKRILDLAISYTRAAARELLSWELYVASLKEPAQGITPYPTIL